MDVLLQDLGPTGVITLYGEQLRKSRLRIIELENRLALKTSECEAVSRLAQEADDNRAALQNELHRLGTDANLNQREPYSKLEPEEEGLGAWSGAGLEVELAAKDERIELLAEQLEQQGEHAERLAQTLERKDGAEERQRQKIDELETSLVKHQACEREYNDLKRRMKEMHDSRSSSKQTRKYQEISSSDEDDSDTSDEENAASCVHPALPTLKNATFDHLQQAVSAFPSHTQLPKLDKQNQRLGVRNTDILQKYMANRWPLKPSLIIRSVMKCGSHAWVPGPLHYLGNNTNKTWVACSSEQFYDKTIELFHIGVTLKGAEQGAEHVTYMGSYQAIKLPELINLDFTKLPAVYQRDIQRKITKSHDIPKGEVKNAILQGRVDVECLGLQYRGFDSVLHNAVMSIAKKRKAPSASGTGAPKKKKKKRS